MRLLVTGASSQIGYFMLQRLLQAGHVVWAISRQARPVWIVEHKNLYWLNNQQLTDSVKSTIEAIISAGPMLLTHQLIPECKTLQTVVVISTSSVHFKQQSSNQHEAELIQALASQEQALFQLAQQRQLNCSILRPTLVYGAGLDKNLCQVAALVKRIGITPVAHHAKGLRQPVHADDLALACQQLITTPKTGIWFVGGGTRLTYAAMVKQICLCLGKGRVIVLPMVLMKLLLDAAHLFGRATGVNSSMFMRQRVDLIVDNKVAEIDWGWRPREFELDLSMLVEPQEPFGID